jgi:hypothetical protein
VLEKEYPTFDPGHKISSSGVHIQIPRIKVRAGIEQSIRRSLLRRMEEFFPNLVVRRPWDNVYDASPSSHSGKLADFWVLEDYGGRASLRDSSISWTGIRRRATSAWTSEVPSADELLIFSSSSRFVLTHPRRLP